MSDNPNEPKPIFAEQMPDVAFGEYNDDGSIRQSVEVSAISGKPLSAGDPYIRIPDSNLFYRITAEEWRTLRDTTDTDRQAVNDETRQRLMWASGDRGSANAAPDASFRREYNNVEPIQEDEEG